MEISPFLLRDRWSCLFQLTLKAAASVRSSNWSSEDKVVCFKLNTSICTFVGNHCRNGLHLLQDDSAAQIKLKRLRDLWQEGCNELLGLSRICANATYACMDILFMITSTSVALQLPWSTGVFGRGCWATSHTNRVPDKLKEKATEDHTAHFHAEDMDKVPGRKVSGFIFMITIKICNIQTSAKMLNFSINWLFFFFLLDIHTFSQHWNKNTISSFFFFLSGFQHQGQGQLHYQVNSTERRRKML